MIAIHNCPGSFSDRWITYCDDNKISYKLVNCYSPDIILQLKDCNGLMWHWILDDYRAQNFARQLIFSIEKMGIKVYPSFNTCWHYDDKVGQKYLLEAINAPLVSSYTFYDEDEALDWIDNTEYPKVFKLRGGASSNNVRLVKSKRIARKIIKKAFNKGFPLVNKFSNLKQRIWVLKRDKNIKSLIHLIKGIIRLVIPKEGLNLLQRQKGYVYFQQYVPNNKFDDRIIIIGEKAVAVRRFTRKNDFRASGSGLKAYEKDLFNKESLKIAYGIAKKLNSQSIAFDFIYDKDIPKIVEISYAFIIGEFYDSCPGYWDENLNWHNDNVNLQRYIIEDFINSLK